jgi:hypothetical protein
MGLLTFSINVMLEFDGKREDRKKTGSLGPKNETTAGMEDSGSPVWGRRFPSQFWVA